LNIHSHKYDNIELPRLVLAMAMGVPVVSEACYGLSDIVPDGIIQCVDIGCIASATCDLLGDELRMNQIRERSTEWIANAYTGICWSRWSLLLEKLTRQAIWKFALAVQSESCEFPELEVDVR
jgi:glycosyltransferase involved in cell wall biosynthesis